MLHPRLHLPLGLGVTVIATLALAMHAWAQSAADLSRGTESLFNSGNIAITALTFICVFLGWRLQAAEKRFDTKDERREKLIEELTDANLELAKAMTSLQNNATHERENNALEFATIRQTLMLAIPSASDLEPRPRRKSPS